ncbi:hypothetical protein [Sphingomonas mucosissima]|nr:hypothetical protein [Sphingomonas mucosissima]
MPDDEFAIAATGGAATGTPEPLRDASEEGGDAALSSPAHAQKEVSLVTDVHERLAETYRRLTGGRRTWLSVHLAEDAVTPFGSSLLEAIKVIEGRLSGAGERFIAELADIRYMPASDNRAGWKAGFEQLVQKLGEVLVARTLFEADWPEGTTFTLEPTNPNTGARPEVLVDTPERQWLFEVKCPAFIDYQDRRDANPRQLPVRGPLGELPGMLEGTTLPRDNVLKDFLASAERKFHSFSTKDRTGVLVVVWDAHIFEATSALSHSQAGLLKERSWHRRNGVRVPYAAVDGVILLNHLEVIKVSAQEMFEARQEDPFRIVPAGQPPNVWCPNLGGGDLDAGVAALFNARPLDEVSVAADYSPKDFVMWIDVEAAARAHRRGAMRRRLLRGVSETAISVSRRPTSVTKTA